MIVQKLNLFLPIHLLDVDISKNSELMVNGGPVRGSGLSVGFFLGVCNQIPFQSIQYLWRYFSLDPTGGKIDQHRVWLKADSKLQGKEEVLAEQPTTLASGCPW